MGLRLIRRACGFQNLVGTSVYGGHDMSPLIGIGLKGGCQTLVWARPHVHMPTGAPAVANMTLAPSYKTSKRHRRRRTAASVVKKTIE